MILEASKVNTALAVKRAIDTAKGSVDEISLNAFETRSLSSLKENFQELLNDGVITEKEFNAIFSEATITELRPYKGTIMALTDTEMGIVSKDYFIDIVSYIIGFILPSMSRAAWAKAKTLVEGLGFDTSNVVDIKSEIPLEVFIANNYDIVLESKINIKYHHVAFPVRTKITFVNCTEEYIKEGFDFVEIPIEDDSTLDTIKNLVETKIESVRKLEDTIFNENAGIAFIYDVSYWGLLTDLKDYIAKVDFSTSYTEYGLKHQLPIFESREEIDPPYYDEYYL